MWGMFPYIKETGYILQKLETILSLMDRFCISKNEKSIIICFFFLENFGIVFGAT